VHPDNLILVAAPGALKFFAWNGYRSIIQRLTDWWKLSGPGTVIWVLRYLKPAFCRVRLGATLKACGSQNSRFSFSRSK
jgi:hypothetical protein